jgi:hypothetical protein
MSLAEAAGFAEKEEKEWPNAFFHFILINFAFLCVLCGLERSGREKSLCLFLYFRHSRHFGLRLCREMFLCVRRENKKWA